MLLQICIIPSPLEDLNLESSNTEELGLVLTKYFRATGTKHWNEFMIPSLRNQNRKNCCIFF